MDEHFEKLKKELPGKIETLQQLMRKYDPFNVIANISLRHHIYPAIDPSAAIGIKNLFKNYIKEYLHFRPLKDILINSFQNK